jgi:hypothetical protein
MFTQLNAQVNSRTIIVTKSQPVTSGDVKSQVTNVYSSERMTSVYRHSTSAGSTIIVNSSSSLVVPNYMVNQVVNTGQYNYYSTSTNGAMIFGNSPFINPVNTNTNSNSNSNSYTSLYESLGSPGKIIR